MKGEEVLHGTRVCLCGSVTFRLGCDRVACERGSSIGNRRKFLRSRQIVFVKVSAFASLSHVCAQQTTPTGVVIPKACSISHSNAITPLWCDIVGDIAF